MTTICVKGKTISADRMTSIGTIQYHDTCKLVERSDSEGRYAIAGSGCVSDIQAVEDWYNDTGRNEDEYPENLDESVQVIVLREDGELHVFEHDSPNPAKFTEVTCLAFGCGEQPAMGAMLMGADTEKAIEIASMVTPGTGSKCDTVSFERKKK